MIISWKTDGSAGAVDTVRNWLEEGSNHNDLLGLTQMAELITNTK